jgi:hypothetical protein
MSQEGLDGIIGVFIGAALVTVLIMLQPLLGRLAKRLSELVK